MSDHDPTSDTEATAGEQIDPPIPPWCVVHENYNCARTHDIASVLAALRKADARYHHLITDAEPPDWPEVFNAVRRLNALATPLTAAASTTPEQVRLSEAEKDDIGRLSHSYGVTYYDWRNLIERILAARAQADPEPDEDKPPTPYDPDDAEEAEFLGIDLPADPAPEGGLREAIEALVAQWKRVATVLDADGACGDWEAGMLAKQLRNHTAEVSNLLAAHPAPVEEQR